MNNPPALQHVFSFHLYGRVQWQGASLDNASTHIERPSADFLDRLGLPGMCPHSGSGVRSANLFQAWLLVLYFLRIVSEWYFYILVDSSLY